MTRRWQQICTATVTHRFESDIPKLPPTTLRRKPLRFSVIMPPSIEEEVKESNDRMTAAKVDRETLTEWVR
ncbi:MAG: hypothetical protein Fues2KO_23810 [Fuerstiella sp.]